MQENWAYVVNYILALAIYFYRDFPGGSVVRNPLAVQASIHGIIQAKYWRKLPCPPLGDLPNLGIKPWSLALQTDSLRSEYSADHMHLGAPKPRCRN